MAHAVCHRETIYRDVEYFAQRAVASKYLYIQRPFPPPLNPRVASKSKCLRARIHPDRRYTSQKMSRPKHIEVIDKTPSAVAKVVQEPKGKNSLISLAAELQLEIVHYLPSTSLPSICRLSERWRRVGREELLRWLLSIPPGGAPKHVIGPGVRLLHQVILNFIETNNADALQHLLDLKAEIPPSAQGLHPSCWPSRRACARSWPRTRKSGSAWGAIHPSPPSP